MLRKYQAYEVDNPCWLESVWLEACRGSSWMNHIHVNNHGNCGTVDFEDFADSISQSLQQKRDIVDCRI